MPFIAHARRNQTNVSRLLLAKQSSIRRPFPGIVGSSAEIRYLESIESRDIPFRRVFDFSFQHLTHHPNRGVINVMKIDEVVIRLKFLCHVAVVQILLG